MKKTFTIQFMLTASIGLLLIALCSVNARAQETISINGNDYPILSGFTATAYQQGDNTWNNQEGYKKLVDGNKGSKWLSSNETNWLDLYIEFNYSTAFVPKGYLLTTGNDTESHPNRNPKNWVLKGKLQLTDEWTTIAFVTNDDRLTATNTTDVLFELSDNTSPYRYSTPTVLKTTTTSPSSRATATSSSTVMESSRLSICWATSSSPATSILTSVFRLLTSRLACMCCV